MPRTGPFGSEHGRYEDWFARHAAAYQSELLAVRALLPVQGFGLEIGVGTGRFAAPLGVRIGIDPAGPMLRYAAERGIRVVQGVAEALPFRDAAFDYALAVTTICFVDDPHRMLVEASRVLRPGGALCIGFIDRESQLGRSYLAHRAQNGYYRSAVFYSSEEVAALLAEAGFRDPAWMQTLSGPLEGMTRPEPAREGYGDGGFAVVRALKGQDLGVGVRRG
jgi:SAM-dependent methyltransferase